MSDQRYTVLLVPDKPGRVTRLQVKGRSVKFALGGLIAAALLFIAMTTASILSYQKLAEMSELKTQNQTQREQLLLFAAKLDDLKQTLDRVSEFDSKLRVLTNMDDGEVRIPGAGGPERGESSGITSPTLGEDLLMNRIQRELSHLSEAARLEEQSLQELSSSVQDKRSLLSATPSILPAQGWISSHFGARVNPFSGQASTHYGLDVAASIGTPIYAPANGTIIFTGVRGGYGKLISIDHGYGVTTRYAHLSEFHVKPGQRVTRGDRIGSVGNTGRSTGPHLHYEVRVNNVPVNPRRYILD